jgi:hypothetical protein
MSNFRPSWSPEARGRARRAYLFVVTSLAVCVFGLLFLPGTDVTETEVNVEIEQRLSGRSAKEVTDAFDRWVANDANLRRAVRALTFEETQSLTNDGHVTAQSTPTAYASWSLHPHLASGDAADSLTLTISCFTDPAGLESASDVATLVNHLAQEYVDDQLAGHLLGAEQDERAASELCDLAQHRYFAVQDELRDFEEEMARRPALPAPAPRRDYPTSVPTPTVKTVEPSPQYSASPDWIEVQSKLEQLRRQRETLLVRLTEAHPQVKVLDDEIAQVARRVTVTARYVAIDEPVDLDQPEEPADPPTRLPPVAPTAPPVEDQQETRRIAEESSRLKQEVDVASAEFSAAQDELQIAKDALHSIRQAVPVRIESLAKAPEPVEPSSGRVTLAVLGCFALVLGGGACVKGVRNDPTLRSAAEVERALGLPVVGILAVDHRADAKRPVAAPPGWTRRLSRGAELFLSIFALVLMGLAVTDLSFASECWSDPVRAPSNVVHQAVHVLSGYPS